MVSQDLSAVRKILFVCTGNTCRSAMAEYLFRDRLKKAGLVEYEVGSAGVAAYAGAPSPEEALRVLSKRGLDGKAHRARLLSEALVDWADLILTMDTRHQTAVAMQFPRGVGKVHVMKSFVGAEGRRDIADPIGRPQAEYNACAEDIEKALDKLLEKLKEQPKEKPA